MEIKISIEPEFEFACDLLYVKPEEIIQAFISNVSFSHYCSTNKFLLAKKKNNTASKTEVKENQNSNYSNSNDTLKMIATDFLINYNSKFNHRVVPARSVHIKFFKKFRVLINELQTEPNFKLRYIRLSQLFGCWHREMIKKISKKDALIDVKSRKERYKL